jgi:hypothetical protein
MVKLADLWTESIIVPVHIKGDEIDCNNYQGLWLKILSNIILSRSSPYIEERRVVQKPDGVTTQKTTLFIVTALIGWAL